MKHEKLHSLLLFLLTMVWFQSHTVLFSEDLPLIPKTGIIKGKLVDSITKMPLAGALVGLIGTSKQTLTDKNGLFKITEVKVGNYQIKFSYEGFVPLIKPDIIVKSKRFTQVYAEMELISIEKKIVTVTAGYFSKAKEQVTGSVNFSSEEIRRAPGSAGDVSRILFSLPSVAKVNDEQNTLIVRGGSPMENSFFIDNIEIPNINHFGFMGTSSGHINLLNVDFIQDVNFYSGGFSSIYGDKLSSIMDISFREGNRESFDAQLDLNFAGFGGVFEGPLGKNGSFMLAARQSYLDLLLKAIGTGALPRFNDYQGKLVFDLSAKNKISILGILGNHSICENNEEDKEKKSDSYHDFSGQAITFGANWFSIWSEKIYSNTSVSYTNRKYNTLLFDTFTDELKFDNNSSDQTFTLRNVNNLTLNHWFKAGFGFEIKHLVSSHKYIIQEEMNSLGDIVPGISIDSNTKAQKISLFSNFTLHPFRSLTINLGARGSYFSYNKNYHLSPRLSLEYKISNRTSVTGSAGIFYQTLPLVLLYQNPDFKNLKDPKSYHYCVGINHMLTNSTKLSIELYKKEYYDLPMNPCMPSLFVFDLGSEGRSLFDHRSLNDKGRGNSYGIEFIIQKKLKSKVYGMLSGAYFVTRYRDLTGIWKNRLYDNRFVFSFEGGFKPNNKWDFSLRWIYAGGTPYTPFDITASKIVNRGIFDRNKINAERKSDYHSLNVRIDRRWNFRNSNLIVYFSVWNAYNRNNVSGYYWNVIGNEPATKKQWSLLPVAGIEFEF